MSSISCSIINDDTDNMSFDSDSTNDAIILILWG